MSFGLEKTMNFARDLFSKIEGKDLTPVINLDRPFYIQPEDSIIYRSYRILLICGIVNKDKGLSKELIACIDFLLRNRGYQKKFIIEYFKNQNNIIEKLNKYSFSGNIDFDSNLVQYKSIPWDLRFNDMFLFLYARGLINIKDKSDLRILISEKGMNDFERIKDIFVDEVNFLSIFGKQIYEERVKRIIIEVIPNTYWRENENSMYK
jgi:hypothetical protein